MEKYFVLFLYLSEKLNLLSKNPYMKSVTILKSVKLMACLTLTLLLTNCATKKDIEVNVLQINKIIPKNNVFIISTEDNQPFSIRGKNVSSQLIVLETPSSKITLEPKQDFDLVISANSNIKVKNSSDKDARVNMRIKDHTSKIISSLEEIK
ncbi:hypothetical protein C4F49_15020 [Sphingobacterium sp. KB22]|uniref:Uncharacterized protein n=2 Tax=Sphingobacterium hungaricum TaxID=2082723 RepID=A0A928V2L4_9SPHI|nr:hypothetical protein [Sphingobacterium hungaricum]